MAAHMGGLLSGFIVGYAFYPSLISQGQTKFKSATILLTAVLTIAAGSMTLQWMKHSDAFKFDGIVSEIGAIQESLANFQDQLPENSIEAFLFFETEMLPEWEKEMALADQAQGLQLSDDKALYRDYLVKWISLNFRRHLLIRDQVIENARIHHSEIQQIDEELAKLTLEKKI